MTHSAFFKNKTAVQQLYIAFMSCDLSGYLTGLNGEPGDIGEVGLVYDGMTGSKGEPGPAGRDGLPGKWLVRIVLDFTCERINGTMFRRRLLSNRKISITGSIW